MRNTDPLFLHPSFRAQVREVEARLMTAQIPLSFYEGARTPWRQAELYARGRTCPGHIVTHSKAWQSFHQYGLAADFVFLIDGQWRWEEPAAGMWARFHSIAQGVGLDTLSFERPHVQFRWPLARLRMGEFPDHGRGAHWQEWLGQQIEQWGSHDVRLVAQIVHPAAPTPMDIDARPALPMAIA